MLKGILTVFASYILIATTSIGKICHALRLLHVPKILVTEILLIYRYITVLLDEVRKMTQAYELRAPGRRGIAFREWGSFAGLLLLRQFVLALVCAANIQFQIHFPPITITAVNVSSVICRNQPARSPVIPPK